MLFIHQTNTTILQTDYFLIAYIIIIRFQI